jgi:pilus assembly protein CpaB
MMRGRTVVLFLIALLLAGGTALLVRSSLTQRPTVALAPTPAPAPAPQKLILVAGVAIARGQILKPGDVAWRPWPEAAISGGFIVAGAQPEKSFAGWVAREPFVAGEPIVKAKIVAPGDHGFLAAVLKPGMRAVSVAVDQTSDVSGFIFPGDRVDLLTNLAVAEGANSNGYQRKAAQTVLRDVRVVAIDQRLDSKDGQAVVARTVTLEVTPKQSEIVALAADMGKLSLSLRSLAAASDDKPAVLAAADSTEVGSPDPPADSIDGRGPAGFTLDSEVNPLVPKPLIFNHNYSDGKVTVLRGTGTSGTSGGSQPGS